MSQISAFIILLLLSGAVHAQEDVDPNLANETEIESGLADNRFCPDCSKADYDAKLKTMIQNAKDLRYLLKDPSLIATIIT